MATLTKPESSRYDDYIKVKVQSVCAHAHVCGQTKGDNVLQLSSYVSFILKMQTLND